MEFKNPYETLQQKGRGYSTKGKYPRIHVFSRSVTELDRLVREFGGNYYRHRSGHLWVFTGDSAIDALLKKLDAEGFLPSVYSFESIME